MVKKVVISGWALGRQVPPFLAMCEFALVRQTQHSNTGADA